MQSLSSRVVTGRTILERLHGLTVPDELRPFVAFFEEEHQKFEAAYLESQQAEAKRDEALAAIGRADGELDVALEELSLSVITARLGDRRKPLARYSSFTPSKIIQLAYAKEIQEIERIAAKLSKEKPPEPVVAAIGRCLQRAADVKSALSSLSAPNAEYTSKLEARDALIPEWERAYAKLERRAQVAWEDQPGVVKAVFARPDSVQQPITRRRKRKAATPS